MAQAKLQRSTSCKDNVSSKLQSNASMTDAKKTKTSKKKEEELAASFDSKEDAASYKSFHNSSMASHDEVLRLSQSSGMSSITTEPDEMNDGSVKRESSSTDGNKNIEGKSSSSTKSKVDKNRDGGGVNIFYNTVRGMMSGMEYIVSGTADAATNAWENMVGEYSTTWDSSTDGSDYGLGYSNASSGSGELGPTNNGINTLPRGGLSPIVEANLSKSNNNVKDTKAPTSEIENEAEVKKVESVVAVVEKIDEKATTTKKKKQKKEANDMKQLKKTKSISSISTMGTEEETKQILKKTTTTKKQGLRKSKKEAGSDKEKTNKVARTQNKKLNGSNSSASKLVKKQESSKLVKKQESSCKKVNEVTKKENENKQEQIKKDDSDAAKAEKLVDAKQKKNTKELNQRAPNSKDKKEGNVREAQKQQLQDETRDQDDGSREKDSNAQVLKSVRTQDTDSGKSVKSVKSIKSVKPMQSAANATAKTKKSSIKSARSGESQTSTVSQHEDHVYSNIQDEIKAKLQQRKLERSGKASKAAALKYEEEDENDFTKILKSIGTLESQANLAVSSTASSESSAGSQRMVNAQKSVQDEIIETINLRKLARRKSTSSDSTNSYNEDNERVGLVNVGSVFVRQVVSSKQKKQLVPLSTQVE